MSDEKKIDYKELSRKILFEGVVSASKYAAECTDTSIDDLAVKGVESLGHLFLDKKEE